MSTVTRTTERAREGSGGGARAGEREDAGIRIPRWLPPVVFAALTILLFREFIFSRDMLFGSDTMLLGYMARVFYAEALQVMGEFPMWNPLLFGGLPFIDGMHGDVFYPTSALLFFMEAHRALGWKLVLHVFLAGLFTFGWLRSIGAGRPAALFGGVVYMLGAHLVSLVYPGHDGKLFVTALTPLVFWLAERAVTRRGYGEFAAFALSIALLIFTAHMQLAYFAVWGVSLYYLFRLVQVWRSERSGRTVARLFGLFALSGVLGAGAAAVQLAAPYLYLQEYSHRAEQTIEAEGESGYEFSTSWSMHPEEAAALVVPEFAGWNLETDEGREDTYWGRNPFRLNHVYAGFLPLLLLPIAFLRRRHSRDVFFAALALLALLYALGDTTPAFRVFYALVPGVALFRAPDSIMFLFGLSVATLGAFGLERALTWARGSAAERRAIRRYLWGATAAVGVLALLASAGVIIDLWRSVVYPQMAPQKMAALEANLPNIRLGFWAVFLLAALSTAAWELLERGISRRTLVFGAIVLLAIIDLWRIDARFIRTIDPERYFAADQSIRFLQNQQAEGEIFRVFDVGAYRPNLPALHGIEQLTGHHGNELGRYRELMGGEQAANLAASELRLLDLANVRYLLSPQPIQLPGYRPAFQGGGSLVYENENALPRAFLVGAVEVAGEDEAVDRLISPDFDFRSTALVPEPLPDGVEIQPSPQGRVEWLERGLDEHTLRVTADRPALLVITENHYPAWTARVDGESAPLLRVNHTFRAVPVPEGTHEIRLDYRSGVVRASAVTSVVLVLLLLGTVVAGRVRRTRLADPAEDAG